jgi:hypothetical protein
VSSFESCLCSLLVVVLTLYVDADDRDIVLKFRKLIHLNSSWSR